MKYYITGIRRGLGKALVDKYGNCDSLEECDVFINCKHDGFSQVSQLYSAIKFNKNIVVINIGSYASDWIFHPDKNNYSYAVEKKALRDANSQLFDHGYNVTCVNFGLMDTESQVNNPKQKISVEYAVNTIDWVLSQPHRVKELTVTP